MAKKKFSLDKEALYNKLMPSNSEEQEPTDVSNASEFTDINNLLTENSKSESTNANAGFHTPSGIRSMNIENTVATEETVLSTQSSLQTEGEIVNHITVGLETANNETTDDSIVIPVPQEKTESLESTPLAVDDAEAEKEEIESEIIPAEDIELSPSPMQQEIEIADEADTAEYLETINYNEDWMPVAEQPAQEMSNPADTFTEAKEYPEQTMRHSDDAEANEPDIFSINHTSNPSVTPIEHTQPMSSDHEIEPDNIMGDKNETEDIISVSEQTFNEIPHNESASIENMCSVQTSEQSHDETVARVSDIENIIVESHQTEEHHLAEPAQADIAASAENPVAEKPAILKHNTEINMNALSLSMPINLIEKIVWANINGILKSNQICNCSRCQADAASIALNKITTKYISAFSSDQALGDFYYKTHFAEIMSAMLLACSIVKNSPRHDEQSVAPTEKLQVHNLSEDLVNTHLRKMISSYNGCCCDRCLSDIAAIMLNKIPPKYFITSEGKLFAKLVLMEQQYHVDLTTQFFKASYIVQQTPNH